MKTILEGSVRTAGQRLRVVAQLTSVENGYQLWSERYDREMEDVFAIQDEIAARITEALRGKLTVGDEPHGASRHSRNLDAYHLYLKGRHHWFQQESDSLSRAAEFFEKAVEKDPTYALAHAALAETYTSLGIFGLRPEIARARATAAIEKALGLAEELPEVQAALGLKLHYLDWTWGAAEKAYRRALRLNPHYVLPYCWYGYLLAAQDRHEEAIRMAERARERDRLSAYARGASAHILLAAGRTEEAMAEARESLEIERHFALALHALGHGYVLSGRQDDVSDVYERLLATGGRSPFNVGNFAWALAAVGLRDKAEELLQELNERSKREYVPKPVFAWIHSALGRMDEAFDALDEAFEERHPHLSFIHMGQNYAALRTDPRYRKFLRKMNLGAAATENSE